MHLHGSLGHHTTARAERRMKRKSHWSAPAVNLHLHGSLGHYTTASAEHCMKRKNRWSAPAVNLQLTPVSGLSAAGRAGGQSSCPEGARAAADGQLQFLSACPAVHTPGTLPARCQQAG